MKKNLLILINFKKKKKKNLNFYFYKNQIINTKKIWIDKSDFDFILI
jgi:hypothetical protein